MDYEIDLSTLNSKKTNLNTLKKDSEDAYSEFNSNFSGLSGTELGAMYTSLEASVQRLKTGGANSNTWYNEYITAITSLEEELAAMDSANLAEINEFKGKFEDMFGRVTMPVLKTGGDIHANKKLGERGLRLTGNDNQSKIYNYLSEQGFNDAAICGILANVEHESGFRTDALGDGGTSYGICQWHNSRWDRLKNYCNNNNLDWHSLEGQVSYLVWELQNHYPSVYNSIKNVPNTRQGAYDAAYVWTTDFEVPANRYERGKDRGNTAMSGYWDKYKA